MDEQNSPCIVCQFSPVDNLIIGWDITTVYNHFEKEAFIEMNQKQLFPYKVGDIEYRTYTEWLINILMSPIPMDVSNTLKTISKLLPRVFYPGYD